MKFILSTHNVTLTKAIEDHILARIWQLEHFDRFAIDARVILEHDTTKASDRQFKCSMRLAMPGPRDELRQLADKELVERPHRLRVVRGCDACFEGGGQ